MPESSTDSLLPVAPTLSTHATDPELLAAYVAGNSHAFDELIGRHYRFLRLVALRHSYCEQDAEDALHEAFIKLMRTAATYRGISSVRTWLHTIVVHACYDINRRKRYTPMSPEAVNELCVEPHDPINQIDQRSALRWALAQLPVEQREAVVAMEVYQLSLREASLLLGIPEGTVKSRSSRARSKLLALLSGPDSPAAATTSAAATAVSAPRRRRVR